MGGGGIRPISLLTMHMLLQMTLWGGNVNTSHSDARQMTSSCSCGSPKARLDWRCRSYGLCLRYSGCVLLCCSTRFACTLHAPRALHALRTLRILHAFHIFYVLRRLNTSFNAAQLRFEAGTSSVLFTFFVKFPFDAAMTAIKRVTRWLRGSTTEGRFHGSTSQETKHKPFQE